MRNFLSWLKVSAALIGIWLIGQIILLPMRQKTDRLNKEIKELTQKIDQTYIAFGGEKNLKDELIIRQTEFFKLKSSFLQEENISEVIKLISEQAKKKGLLVNSIKPEQIKSYVNYMGEEVRVLESLCRYLPIRIFGRSRYRQMGEFLNSLKESFEFLVTVEELSLEKDRPTEPELKFEVLINIFVAG